MKKTVKFFGIIILIGFSFTSCELLCEHEYEKGVVVNASSYPAKSTKTCTKCNATEEYDTRIGDTGPAGGIIFYAGHFTLYTDVNVLIGGVTAHYLEAATVNQGTLQT